MLEKTFRPAEVEAKHYDRWKAAGAFAAHPDSPNRPYTIMMPPANVTGSLHIGHALTFTLQDALIRYHRMKGLDALWQPGTDHAGIATQMVVERDLAEKGLTRRELGRERFLEHVWKWKEHSGGTIIRQLRSLGASADWRRERFTMDEGLSHAVLKVFVDLYKQGLIYKDRRLVNWDPKLHTAISDLEVVQQEVQGHLWHFKYPLEGDEGRSVTVATTRPETMLGDTAVAVHPEDERYRDLVGKFAVLPLVGRRLPIVADEYADPETGSGAVKITPAHDFNDFEVGRRHGLDIINVMDSEARMNDQVPEKYRDLDRFEARKAVVADLEALGLVAEIEDYSHSVPYGDRGNVPIEPWLTEQWYVDAKTLAKPAIEAVETGQARFVPSQWANTYFEWMRNIQPWCISRQLWWGHRIPAWYGPDGGIFVEMSEEEALEAAHAHYGKPVELARDPDVLDTWFSSALWPFSTLGWPERTPELERYYPGDVLVTGFDIIFFWVARMMMMGLHSMGDVPFRTIYIHGLVRDELGQKMSKSKGNALDPLEVVEKYGCDALRFTLASLAVPAGQDVKLSESRIEGNRNFMTKLWNAARFCDMSGCRFEPDFDPRSVRQEVNRWIMGKLAQLRATVDESFSGYRFNDVAGALYHFIWHEFCDWYLEFAKPMLQQEEGQVARETRATAAWVLGKTLHMLHPVAPFATEEIWETLTEGKGGLLITAEWPALAEDLTDPAVDARMDWVIRTISRIREVRAEMNVPAAAKLQLLVKDAEPAALERLQRHRTLIERLARVRDITESDEVPAGAVQIVREDATLVLPLAEVIDIGRERERLRREIDKASNEIQKLDQKLRNEKFVSRAPVEVVEEQRQRSHEARRNLTRLQAALENLPEA